MSRPITIDFFCEDHAHQSLVVPLTERVASELERKVRVRAVSARGGPSVLWQEFEVYTSLVHHGTRERPDFLVACIDGNCRGHAERRREAADKLSDEWRSITVFAIPNAHVERWYMIDQKAFQSVVGGDRFEVPDKCERGLYKRLLERQVKIAGQLAPLRGVEFGPELAHAMNLYRASKVDASFKSFLDDLRRMLKQTQPPSGENG